MAMKRKVGRPRKNGGTTINFSGVESGRRRCPDGYYNAEITSAELQESSTGNPMIAAKWKILDGKYKGVTLYDNISLVPQALWRLKTLLEAVGIDAQEEDVHAEEYAEELVGTSANITVTNEKYEGEDRPKVTGYEQVGEAEEEEEDEEEEEEEPKVRNKVKAKGKAKKEEEEEDEDEDSEEEGESEEDEDSEEEEEDEEDEEEPKSKPKKRGRPPKIKEGSRVKFDDGDGNIIKGRVTALNGDEAEVEDKNGDSYQNVPLDQIELA